MSYVNGHPTAGAAAGRSGGGGVENGQRGHLQIARHDADPARSGRHGELVHPGGILTITLTGGGTHSGQVPQETRIEWVPATPTSTEGDDDQDEQGSSGGSIAQFDSVHSIGTSPQQGDEQGQGARDTQDGEDGADGTTCTTAALTPGAVVRVAELNITGAGAVWDH